MDQIWNALQEALGELRAQARSISPEHGDDLVGTALLKAYAYLERVELGDAPPIENTHVWLRAIVYRAFLDESRSCRRRQSLINEQGERALLTLTVSDFTRGASRRREQETRRLLEHVDHILAALAETTVGAEDLALFRAHYVDGTPWKKLGEGLGLGADAVRRRVARRVLPSLTVLLGGES